MVDPGLEGFQTPQKGAMSQKAAIMTVSVSIFFVEGVSKKTVILLRTDVNNALIDIKKHFGLDSGFDAVLYCVENFWSKEIVDVLPSAIDACFGCSFVALSDLRNDDEIDIRRNFALESEKQMSFSCIGPALRFDYHAQRDLLEGYQEGLRELVNDKGFIGFRKIRGDGNCYYRAIIYGLLESIILRHDWSGFQFILEKIVHEDYPVCEKENKFLHYLSEAAGEGSRWKTVQNLQRDFLDINTSVDEGSVLACKRLSSMNIKRRWNENARSGITIGEACSYSSDNISSCEDYCDSRILPLGICAEGPLVELDILSDSLSLRCHVASISASGLFMANIHAVVEPIYRFPQLHLLLLTNHFDLIYVDDGEDLWKDSSVIDQRRRVAKLLSPATLTKNALLRSKRRRMDPEGLIRLQESETRKIARTLFTDDDVLLNRVDHKKKMR